VRPFSRARKSAHGQSDAVHLCPEPDARPGLTLAFGQALAPLGCPREQICTARLDIDPRAGGVVSFRRARGRGRASEDGWARVGCKAETPTTQPEGLRIDTEVL